MDLKLVLESLLFVVGDEGLSLEEINDILDIDNAEKLIEELKKDYENRGITIEFLGNHYKLVSKKEYKDYIKKIVEKEENSSLSQSALETLAVIAYNGPVTRNMVDEIRGVGSSHMIRRLMMKGFIKEVGKSELPGKPNLYGVTDSFLDYFGLSSINDLPVIEKEEEEEDLDTDLYESRYKEDVFN